MTAASPALTLSDLRACNPPVINVSGSTTPNLSASLAPAKPNIDVPIPAPNAATVPLPDSNSSGDCSLKLSAAEPAPIKPSPNAPAAPAPLTALIACAPLPSAPPTSMDGIDSPIVDAIAAGFSA